MTELEDGSIRPSRMNRLVMLVGVVVPLLGFAAAIVLMWFAGWMNWLFFSLFLGGWLLTGLGVTVGYHRLLAHRSFKTPRWLSAMWAVLGSMAGQGPALTWCAMHRKHHAHTDKPGDPHSPHQHGSGLWNALRGFLHAHTGWLFSVGWNEKSTAHYAPDLQQDRWIRVIDRTYVLWFLLGLGIPTFIGLLAGGGLGAFLGFLWGGLARVFFLHHVTWSINSICHMFGHQAYQSDDHSKNNFMCALLACGEGWHNNHHAFPSSARHGLKWWQFDLSWLVIQTMRICGLAWNVRTPSPKSVESKRL